VLVALLFPPPLSLSPVLGLVPPELSTVTQS
jgi:hypothetical protein